MQLGKVDMFALALLVLQAAATPDTLPLATSASTIRLDGVADSAEYGRPAVELHTGQGVARIWLVRSGQSVYVAAAIPDSSFYWGDDFVVSLDPRGDATPAPGDDDIQWYMRRVTDSSVVLRGNHGRWSPPAGDPDWRLGRERAGEGWEVKSASGLAGWTIELRLDADWLGGDGVRRPAMAFRIYDDAPHGWHAWPAPPERSRPTVVERMPNLWVAVGG
jgi:hypothetical protein